MCVCVCVCVFVHTRIIFIYRFMVDKRRAERGECRNRVPEKELYFYGLIGGAIGGYIAMWMFDHKTAKPQFCIPYTVLFIANLAVVLVAAAVYIIH